MNSMSEDKLVQGHDESTGVHSSAQERVILADLPEIPTTDLSFEFSSLIDPASAVEAEKVQKRASNVMKLAQENEKLKAELKAMTDRLEAAERRREQLSRKEQKILEEPSS
ncbi:hypothetical protein M413DRAFT_438352 [Hebeloma cylindrosporum]|uniref:Uncharacterized protein n=1 Tax=Hebeloma cylindrosporum TaxID=76867 RepID=A0A0C3CKG2_HEBCY|nr:hypothetical protein M413DRAFT_438352 [Hebeloma cylindrosporum h7]